MTVPSVVPALPVKPRPEINPRPRVRKSAPATPSAAATSAPPVPTKLYEVGYGKPPAKHRFKPGQSGNPNGRPKGAKGLKALARKLLTDKVSVRTGHGEKRVMRIEAMLMKMIEQASKGDFRAAQALMNFYTQAVPDEPADRPAEVDLSPGDEATLALFAAELRGRETGNA